MRKAFIDPRCNIEYSAFYIKGLYDLLGKENVSFDIHYFSDLTNAENLNVVLTTDHRLIKYTIDYNDSPYVNKIAYEWCSYYGKINLRKSFLSDDMSEKIINISPGFGIRIWNLMETGLIAIQNYHQITPRPHSIKKFLSNYAKQIRHLPLEFYQPAHASPNYVFSVNTLWFSNEWINTDKTVNWMRLNFYKAVSAIATIHAEIGFVYSQKKNKNPDFQAYVTDKWISKKNYLRKTQQSSVVFNTPAWDLCHGWKIAEYLALGKAIISTPFHNDLPFPLVHGKHIHFVSGSVDDIQEALQKLVMDATYRAGLETQSRLYYEQHVHPKAVIAHLLGDIQVRV